MKQILITILCTLLMGVVCPGQRVFLESTDGQQSLFIKLKRKSGAILEFSSTNGYSKTTTVPLSEVFLFWEPGEWPELVMPILDPKLKSDILEDSMHLIYYQTEQGFLTRPSYRDFRVALKQELKANPWASRELRKGTTKRWIGIGLIGLGAAVYYTAQYINYQQEYPSSTANQEGIATGTMVGVAIFVVSSAVGFGTFIKGTIQRNNAIPAYNTYQLYKSGYVQDRNLQPLLSLKLPLNKR